MAETFLEALTPDEAADLRASGRERHYDTNLALFHEGDDAGSVIVLLAGRAKITVLSSSDREVIVAVRGPGDLLGELAALIDAPRSATVVTIEQVDALIVSGSAFAAFLERNPRVALAILRIVADRLLYAEVQEVQFATHDVVGRVAHRLAELTERYGVASAEGIVLDVPLSQEELASWTGASREAVNKALQVLRSLHMIETGRRRLTVLDAEGLRRLAG
jgi:CRP/FNR family transcriptional regulator, cyclic AMP receptor protein